MPWFKVDDALAMHMKAFAAGNQALGLWVRAGSWSMHQLTDGFIPQGLLPALGGTWDDAAALLNAGLWHPAEGGYQFHDWAEYQPTREQVLAEREAAAERKRRSRQRSQEASQRDSSVTDAASHSSPSRPVPTRPLTDYVSQSESDDSTEQRARNIIQGLGISPDKLLTHISARVGVAVSAEEAMRVATDVLARGGEVLKPQAYVLRSITNDPDAIRAAITAARPTSIPQREPECDQHAGYPLPCERCRRDAAEKE
ncbi:hypothetical protein [Microbacterium binotii]|uniref:Uncharacterized protein n=1 Tax=Microbacterium binotii TaxID=462710 RepID=A0ABN3PGD9_9MICO